MFAEARGRTSGRASALAASVAVAASLLLAACGGGGTSSSQPSAAPPQKAGAGSSTLSLNADPAGKLRFDKSALAAKSGKVTIVMKNPSPLSHSVAIEGGGVAVQGEVVTQGGTSTAGADLKPGSYTFFCTVPGHRQAGMQGTLTVK
jgi:uncharacterized cupredoxin-like copper-binding protein